MSNVESFINSMLVRPIEEQPGCTTNDLAPVTATPVVMMAVTGAAVASAVGGVYAVVVAA